MTFDADAEFTSSSTRAIPEWIEVSSVRPSEDTEQADDDDDSCSDLASVADDGQLDPDEEDDDAKGDTSEGCLDDDVYSLFPSQDSFHLDRLCICRTTTQQQQEKQKQKPTLEPSSPEFGIIQQKPHRNPIQQKARKTTRRRRNSEDSDSPPTQPCRQRSSISFPSLSTVAKTLCTKSYHSTGIRDVPSPSKDRSTGDDHNECNSTAAKSEGSPGSRKKCVTAVQLQPLEYHPRSMETAHDFVPLKPSRKSSILSFKNAATVRFPSMARPTGNLFVDSY